MAATAKAKEVTGEGKFTCECGREFTHGAWYTKHRLHCDGKPATQGRVVAPTRSEKPTPKRRRVKRRVQKRARKVARRQEAVHRPPRRRDSRRQLRDLLAPGHVRAAWPARGRSAQSDRVAEAHEDDRDTADRRVVLGVRARHQMNEEASE